MRYDWLIYKASSHSSEILDQMIEDSHRFFHEDLMRIAQVYQDILL